MLTCWPSCAARSTSTDAPWSTPALAAWPDLDSEAVALARGRWKVDLPWGTGYWSRRRHLGFDDHGRPERLIDLQLLCAGQETLSIRQSDLLVAAQVGPRYWIYTLSPAAQGGVRLVVLQDPAPAAWDPPRVHAGDASLRSDPPWLLPLRCLGASPVLLNAA